MVTSLRFWLISSFSAVLLICLVAIWLFVNAMNNAQKLEDYHSNLKTTRILLLETNKLKEDILLGDFNEHGFYTSQFSDPERHFKALNKTTNYYLRYLERSKITQNYKLGWK